MRKRLRCLSGSAKAAFRAVRHGLAPVVKLVDALDSKACSNQ